MTMQRDPESTVDVIFDALRWLAMPVCVVGSGVGTARSCATGTLSYVALDPPMIATPLGLGSRTYDLAHRAGAFSISLLRDDQDLIAVQAARAAISEDKFNDLSIAVQIWNDVPAMADCGSVLWCSIEEEYAVHDHVICVGRIRAANRGEAPGVPLLRHQARYYATGELCPAIDDATYPL